MSQPTTHHDEPATVHMHDAGCLCCCHFAVDLEAIPEARARRSRRPKYKRSASLLTVS